LPGARICDGGIGRALSDTGCVRENGVSNALSTVRKAAGLGGIAIDLHHIEPGKPTQNAYIESFNRKMREECLRVSCFQKLLKHDE
jgi:transposase InsO family protein